MTQRLTPKQEAFCLKYIETGNGSEAYRLAYDAGGMKPTTINRAAFDLLDNPKIAARVNELQESHRRRHVVTVDSITEELEEARRMALDTEAPAAAISASLGKAKLHGLMSENTVNVNVTSAPLPEQDKALLDEYAAKPN